MNTKPTVLAVLVCDWSGVISDDRLPVYEANMRLLESYGMSRVSFEEWLQNTKARASDYLISQGVVEPKGPGYLEKLYKQTLDEVYRYGIQPRLYPGVLETLQQLHSRRIPVAIVSTHPQENLIEEARRYNLLPFLDNRLIFGGSKDKTQSLLSVCQILNAEPGTVLFVGDTIYDIEAGKRAGVRTAGITTGYHTREMLEGAGPNHILNSFSEVLSLFGLE